MNNVKLEQQLLRILAVGLPVSENPYQLLAEQLATTEQWVIERIDSFLEQGIIKRLGFVVNHHMVGYRANAMVVWDIPDDEVDNIGRVLGREARVTLCYRRPRRLPQWPYNLFTMVHGTNRQEVIAQLEEIVQRNKLAAYPNDLLFSQRQLKQTGSRALG